MGNNLRNQERRNIAAGMVDKFLASSNRLSWALAREKNSQWCVQEWRMGLLIELARLHDDLFRVDLDSAKLVEETILRAYHTANVAKSVTVQTRLTTGSSVPYGEETGRRPHIARRHDLCVPSETEQAMRIISDTPFRVDEGLWSGVMRPYLISLGADRYRYCHAQVAAELDECAATDGVRYVTCDRADEATRIYPDWFHVTQRVNRWLWLFPEEYPVDKAVYSKELNDHYGDWFTEVADKLAGADFRISLLNWAKSQDGDPKEILELIGALWHHNHAMEHGTSAALWEMDAIGSGPSHINAQACLEDPKWLGHLNATSNARASDFSDPKSLLGQHMKLSAPVLFRDTPFGELRKLAGMIASPGTYGGGAVAFTEGFLGISNDPENGWRLADKDGNPIQFEIPKPLQPLVEGVSNPETQVKRIHKFSKLCVAAFAHAFPTIAPANDVARNAWEHGYESTGWPDLLPVQGWTSQPSPLKAHKARWYERRGKIRPMLRMADGTVQRGQRLDVSCTVNALVPNASGTSALAKMTHRCDAYLMALVVITLRSMGVPVFTIHDAFCVPWMYRELACQVYREHFEAMHGIKLLDPHAVMLKH
jgi:hypothetical protein